MKAILSPAAKQQFFDNAGDPAAGFQLHTLAANGATPQTTYSNRAGTVPNSNPIVLDARGEAIVYLTPGIVYDFVLRDAQGQLVWTREDVAADAGSADAVSFTQSGAGAQARTTEDKLREISLSIRDFGAKGDGDGTIGNGTNDSTAIDKALAAANGRTVLVPPVPGVATTYYRIGSNVSLPNGGRIQVQKGARLVYDGGATIQGQGIILYDDLPAASGGRTAYASEQGVNTPLAGQGVFGSSDLNYMYLRESLQQQPGVGSMTGSKVNGLRIVHNFGGSSVHGGRHGFLGELAHGFFPGEGATAATNADRNYVGAQGLCVTYTGDGGTLGSPLGAYFGGSSAVAVRNTAQYILNLSSHEFNTDIPVTPANAVSGHTGLQIASRMFQRGYNFDAALSIGNISGGVGWKNGLAFTNFNGENPLMADSVGFYIQPGMLCGRGIDVRGVTFTNAILDSTGLTLNNGAVDIGLVGTANTPFIDLHSSASITNYDVRIQSTGGSGVDGQGACAIIAAEVGLTHTYPQADNVFQFGKTGARWTQLSAATATINTSDEREKEQIGAISDAVLDAWADVDFVQYKWKEAVERKGDGARWHFGLIAQRVRDTFAAHGLDATELGLLCYDEWEASTEPAQFKKAEVSPEESVTHEAIYGWVPKSKTDPELEYRCIRGPWTEVTKEAVYEIVEVRPEIHHPAGNRWGIRGEECLFLEAALARRDRMRARG